MEAHTYPYEKDKYLNKGRVINMCSVAPRGKEEDSDGCGGTGGRLGGRQGRVTEGAGTPSASWNLSENQPHKGLWEEPQAEGSASARRA